MVTDHYPTYTSVHPAITTQGQVVFNGKLELAWLVVSPANHRASADRFEIASRAHPPRIAIAPGQPKETQDRCVAGGAHTANEVRIVAVQRVGSWPCIPQRVRRASLPRGGQVCQHVLHLLPERPIKASRSLECGHELTQNASAVGGSRAPKPVKAMAFLSYSRIPERTRTPRVDRRLPFPRPRL